MSTTPSGQPLVNIAAPNAAGISYNRYQRFDVDPVGLLLNNSRTPISTAIYTQIPANPNFNGQSARIILNEVVSAIPSNLNGPLSVLGDPAKLIIANPNGIACNGCAFVNTSHVTLTTGVPTLLDAPNGNVTAFDSATALAFTVSGGRIEITGSGLASGLDRLDLIAQTLKIGGPLDIGTGALNLIAGRQTVDHETLGRIANVTGNDRATIGEDLAIDASLLGAMNAGSIRFIATAAGMGVRSAVNLAASSGDLSIAANGDLTLKRADAARNVSITGSGNLAHTGMLAGNDLSVTVNALDNRNQTLAAYGNATISAPTLDNRGGQILAGRFLDITLPQGTFNLSDGTLMGGNGTTVRAGVLTNTGRFTHAAQLQLIADTSITNSGSLLVGDTLTLHAGTELNNSGTLGSVGTLFVVADNLTNSGRLQGDGAVTLQLASLDNRSSGYIIGGGSTQITTTGAFANVGTIGSAGDLVLQAAALTNSGQIAGKAKTTLTADNLSNSGTIQSDGAFTAQVASLSNASTGLLLVGDGSQITASGAFSNDGAIAGMGSLGIQSAPFSNSGAVETLGKLTLQANSLNNSGSLLGHDDLDLTTTTGFTNSGSIEAARDARFTLAGSASNAGGTMSAGRDLTLDTGVSGNFGGMVAANRDLILKLRDYTHGTNETVFLAGQDLRLTANSLTNDDVLEAWRDLSLTVTGALTNRTLLLSGRDIAVKAGSLVNDAGTVEATRDLSITADSVTNGGGMTSTTYVATSQAGYVANVLKYIDNPILQKKLFNEIAPDWVDKNSRTTLINRNEMYLDSGTSIQHIDLVLNTMGNPGTLSAGRNLIAQVSGTLANNGSLITAGQDLSIQANQFDNTAGTNRYYGNIYAGGGYHFLGAYGSANAVTQAGGTVSIQAATQTNSGTIQGSSVYLGGNAVTNGLTDYRYQTPANTLPNAQIDLGCSLAVTPNSPALPGATWTPRGASVFTSTSRLNLLSLPAGSVNNLLPENLRNTSNPFLLDARLEQQAIRDAALKETGQASFLGMNDPEGERAQLYANAASFATDNNLRLGTALSPEQVATLKAPILWYETQSVTGPDGQTIDALVPKVYLPDSARADLAQLNGGVLKANTLDIEANSVRNTGYMMADTLNLNTDTLTNEKRSADWGRYTENVKGGYLEVWGDRVQPGGFISAAHLNLNAGRIDSISGEFYENGQDASPALKALLGDRFVQTTNIDHTQSEMHAKGGDGLLQVVITVVVVVVAIYTGYVSTEALAAAASESAAATISEGLVAGTITSGAEAAAVQASYATWMAGGFANAALSGAAASMAGNATSQLLITGSIDGGQLLKAGASGAISGGIGGYFGNAYGWDRLAAETAGGCVTGEISGAGCASGATTAAAMSSLSWAASEMRAAMIEDSKKFPGICDSAGNCLDNKSGRSVGVNGDDFKGAGGRVNLDLLCAEGRCPIDQTTGTWATNESGSVIMNLTDTNGNLVNLANLLEANPSWRSPRACPEFCVNGV